MYHDSLDESEKKQMRGNRWKGIMKCYPFEEKRLAKWKPPYIVQPKFDGNRCINEPLENSSLLLTSEENPFFSVPHINKQLMDSGLYKMPLDGELYNHNLYLEGGHELIHSIVSRTANIHERHKEMEFWVFDLKIPDEPQIHRMEILNSIKELSNVRICPFWICENLDDVKRIYDKILGRGYEGIIIRHLYNFYEEKRSTYMMKFKPKKQDIYTIVGWNEEISIHGHPKGRIGSIVLSSQNEDIFAVSAGLNDADRDKYWLVREDLIGAQAMVHYQHLTNKKIPKGCFNIEIFMN